MAQGQIVAEGPPDAVMGDQRVIDAYLGSHHDQDLSEDDGGEDPRRGPGRDRGRAREVEARGGEPWLRPTTPTVDRSAHLTAAEGAVLRADDLIAGYLPGRQHPQRRRPLLPGGRAGRHHRPQRRRQVDAAQGAVRPGQDQDRHGDRSRATTSPTSAPTQLVTKGIGFVPQTNNVFPSLTIQENLEMGVYQRPSVVQEALRVRRRAVPRPASTVAASGPARCRAVSGRWWPWAAR